MTQQSVRIWDLPTRVFHWTLAAAVMGMVVTAKVGGNAMEWHIRLGHVVLALLVFRIVWGLVGGHWSRFTGFALSPRRLRDYLRGERHPDDGAGHSPLGSLSVVAMLAALVAQVLSGLFSDDEIAFAGPLTRFVSNAIVGEATGYHKDIGQYLVLGLVAVHIGAIAYYSVIRKQRLVGPMLHGNKILPVATTASTDGALARLAATMVLVLCGALAWWVYSLGSAPTF